MGIAGWAGVRPNLRAAVAARLARLFEMNQAVPAETIESMRPVTSTPIPR